jgi:diguanylate cyclase (GGDEF)-like protein
MAASEPHSSSRSPSGRGPWPDAEALVDRLEEEIGRSERYGTPLSLLLLLVENLDEIASEHGSELREQTLAYIAGALDRELRSFDRVGLPSRSEVAILLPGADGPRGEMVARRVLDRLRAIKVEAADHREPLRISVGLASWRPESTAPLLLERARAAAARAVIGDPAGARAALESHALGEPPPSPS